MNGSAPTPADADPTGDDRPRALLGAVEAGGTKFVCAVGRGPAELAAETRIPTTEPGETLARVVAFFREQERSHGRCAGIGVASFGPLDLDPRSPGWGSLTATPKPGWSGVSLVEPLRSTFGVPVAIDTDVQGAALAESLWGAGRELSSLVYVTVGTGIGGGTVRGGLPVSGGLHPEMGHLRVPRHPDDRDFAGVCPFHGDCLEGLASGPAAHRRWGAPLEGLSPDHPAWEILGFYLAHLGVAIALLIAPARIVVGGGVASAPALLPATRGWMRRLLAGYPAAPALSGSLDDYVVPPTLGARAGVLGALALARGLGGSESLR